MICCLCPWKIETEVILHGHENVEMDDGLYIDTFHKLMGSGEMNRMNTISIFCEL